MLGSILDLGAPAIRPRLVLRAAGGSGTLGFDRAEYDERQDRLRLSRRPVCAASTELTPEGHVLRVSAPDGVVCDVVLTDVRRRLVRDGCVEVTFDPHLRAVLDPDEVERLVAAGAGGPAGPG